MFKIKSSFSPSGDQPKSIETLVNGLSKHKDQLLLGVTGSGKTFTMANIIQKTQLPTLIMAPNKILAAQLYEEMKSFFPENAVEYFISYYDYYQPESYIAKRDIYIEKETSINDKIDRLRHSATRSVLSRDDVIIVASVSCIYGIGTKDAYLSAIFDVNINMVYNFLDFIKRLIELRYERSDFNLIRGKFKVTGDIISVFPAHYENRAWRISFFDNYIESIDEIESITGHKIRSLSKIRIFSNTHYAIKKELIDQAVIEIKHDMQQYVQYLNQSNKTLEAYRIEQRTSYDLEMLQETGTCKGIENYSRYFTRRHPGEAPPTLFEYFPNDSLLFVDESHVTVPQIGAMYKGDRARKDMLIEYGFRLPSARDNRPLKFEEWNLKRPKTIYVSATPGKYERSISRLVVEQIIRPTGLLDPTCIVKPLEHQVDDLISEAKRVVKKGYRVLVTSLTKQMAENLSKYLNDIGMKVQYLHSSIKSLERIQIIHNLRKGNIDVLVGVNLLREGLDIPECGLVAILDADKEGFLRSTSSLIQTIGRASRNTDAKVILYADTLTQSIKTALEETSRRRKMQDEYNIIHNIVPRTTYKEISLAFLDYLNIDQEHNDELSHLSNKELELQMLNAAEELNFEYATKIRNILDKRQSNKS
ncbi:MAG: excinuclease ABC, B subunit [Candidatus Xenolissoclinum pacificiensis L6]|uniref:UvrABC system protein B n=1 Tax=Candidatus Xenolissoclinum pacificiensis L6 TaxID=1401685 RepID=W2V040_9RICK|nr:MAG: excinuclease ABC, B subunit [Candidatus Xenolissoclinum pacificiensis L6]